MKKPSRRDHPSDPSSRNRKECRQGADGRWEFAANGSLIALGTTEGSRRAAYRTADGEVRFLPL